MKADLAQLEKARLEERDLELINANAEWLNREAEDVLEYQSLPLLQGNCNWGHLPNSRRKLKLAPP